MRAQCRTRGRSATSLFLNARRDAVLRRGSGKRPVGMFVWRLTDLYDPLRLVRLRTEVPPTASHRLTDLLT